MDAHVDDSRAARGPMTGGRRWLLAALASGLLAALAEQPAIGRGPLPAEILAPASDALLGAVLTPPLVRAAIGLVSGLLAASILVLCKGWGARAGTFGTVAAAGLASAVTCSVLALPAVPASEVVWWSVAGGAGLVAALLGPVLRDRGLLSLLVVSLVVGAAVIPGRHRAVDEQAAGHTFGRAREAVVQAARVRLFVSLDEKTDTPFRQALARSLLPPFREEPIELLSVDHDSPEQEALLGAGWGGVRFDGNTGKLLEPPVQEGPMPEASFPHRVEARMLQDRGPVAVVAPAEGRFLMRVVTPGGVIRYQGDDPIHGLRLTGDAFDRYVELLAPFDAGALLLVKVETETFPRGTEWFELRE